MADAQKLIEKIISDAQRDAENYRQDAGQKIGEMRAQMQRGIEKRTAEIKRMAKDAMRENKKRLSAVYDLEYRKQLLAAKQEVMEEAKARALDKLGLIEKEAYLALLKKELLNCAENGQGGLILSENEKFIDDAFLDEVNKALKQKDGTGEIRILGEKRAMRGGFIYANGGLEINISLEALLEEAWQRSETDIAQLLFTQS